MSTVLSNGIVVSAERLDGGFSGQQRKWKMDDLVPSVASHLQSKGIRADISDTAMFLRTLTYIYKELYKIEYPQLKAREIIPIDTSVDSGAEYFVYRQMDRQGTAKVIQPMGDDLPRVVASGREYMGRIYSLGVSYAYTIQEVRASALSGIPLPDLLAQEARLAIEELIERIAAFGVTGAMGTPFPQTNDAEPSFGITNVPNATTLTSAVPGGWIAAGTTVQQILADINLATSTMYNNSFGIHTPKTLVLPTTIYSYLATTQRSPTFTDDSLLQYVQKSNPWITKIIDWVQLNKAGYNQSAQFGHERVMFLNDDRRYFSMVIPQPFEQLPPQPVGLSFQIPCHARMGSMLKLLQPQAVLYLDGTAG